jgi:hypothetical protein
MILHLACGDRVPARLDTIRFDIRPGAGDVQGDVRHLPFDGGRFGEIHAFDILEHFWRDEVPAMLHEWHRVAMVGARLFVKVPDLVGLAKAILADPISPNEHVRVLYGGHRWGPGGVWDQHHWGYTAESLVSMLGYSGWDVVDVDSDGLGLSATAVAG